LLVRSQAGINTGSRPRTQTSTVTRRALEKGPTVLVQEVAGAEVISLRVSAPLTPRGTAGFRTGPVSLLHDLLGDETPCQPKTGYHGAGEDDYMPPPTALTVCLDVEPEALQAGLDQILGSLLAPNWPTLTASHAGVARHHSTLAQLGQQALNELLYPVVHGRSATPLVVQDRNQHPRRDYLDHWHAQLVRAEELVITVVGATTEQNVLTALGQTWTSRPWTNVAQGPIPAAPENRAVPTTEPHRVVADTDRALIWLAFPTQGFHESDWLALEVLRQWLNAPQGPLARALATNGLARLAPPSLWHGPGIGHLILAMETMPANETETIQTARQTLAGFALDGPAEEGPLFRAAQRRAALALARGLSTPSQRAAALDEAERGGIRPEQRLAASMEVLNVSAATVQAVAQRLLTPDRARLVVVGPPPTQPTQDTQEQPTQDTQE
jgi:hypothetical protein